MTHRRKRSPLLVAGILLLVLVPAALLAARNPGKAQAQWFDPNWGYRTKIDVANSSGSTQTDFQVSIATDTASLVTAGKMQATCADLRVTDNSGKLLNYWIEPNTCNTTSTQIWVKVPSIPTSGIPVYLYYGNPSALPANYKTTDVFIKELSGSIASWPMDDTTTTQSYARVVNPTTTGRNLILNGTFDTDTVWTKQTGWTIANGVAHQDGTGNGHLLYESYAQTDMIVGKMYQVTFTISNYVSGGIRAWVGTNNGTLRNANGTYTETLIANGGSTTVGIVLANTFVGDVDNFIVTQVNVPSSGTTTNLLTDGNMEASGTSAWTTLTGTPSKQTTNPHGGSQVLRLTSSGVGQAQVGQAILTVGKTYRVYGYARSDGTGIPGVFDGTNYDFSGTTSTAWQPFDFVFTAASGTSLRFYKKDAGTSGYVEFDDVVVAEDNFTRSGELVQDGNMEVADTSLWTPINSATLTKSTASPHGGSNAIRVTYNAVSFPRAEQILLIIGKTYRATGWFRGDGTYAPLFRTDTANKVLGTTSTTWQNFEITFVADGTKVWLSSMATTAGWVEYDDVSVTEVSPLSGSFDVAPSKKPTLGTASSGHLSYAYSFNAASSQYLNVYSSDLNSAFNPSEGTLVAWAKVSGAGVWTDSTQRFIGRIVADSNNHLDIYKDTSSNNLVFLYKAGGTQLSVASSAVGGSTTWFQVVLTWSKTNNQVKTFINGTQVGSTQTGLGTWVGNTLTTETAIGIGDTGTGGNPWQGLINDVHLFNRALSSDEIASTYSSSNGVQAYATSNYTGKELVRKFNSGITTTLSAVEETSTGPAAYWKFDEGSGTQAKDSSTNNNTGSITAGSWQTEDQCVSGKCLQFDGSATFVDAGNKTSLNITGKNITYEAWVKVNETLGASQYRSIAIKSNAAGANWNGLWYVNGSGNGVTCTNGFMFGATSTWLLCSKTTPKIGQWYHLAGVTDGTNASLYVNGVLESSTGFSTAMGTTTQNFLIGKRTDGFFFKGSIDEVKVFPYARTAAQVQADYNSRGSNTATGTNIGLQSTTFLNNGLVGYWKMDEATWSGTASEVVDSSGNGGHGTAVGTTNGKAYPAAGKFGNGGYFDGVDDYVSMNAATIPLGLDFTMSAWIKLSGSPTNGQTGIIKGDNNVNSYTVLEINSSRRLAMEFRDAAAGSGGNSMSGVNNTTLSTSTWYLVTLTVNRTTNLATFYVNGVADGNINIATAPQTIQSHITSVGRHVASFPGNIDDVRVYNRALSPSEISQLYNWAPGPVAYYPLDEGNTGTANDTSGGNNNSSAESTTSITTGKYGKARNFLGTGAGITIADADGKNDFNYNQDFTVSAWIKNPSTQVNTSSTANSIIEKWSSGTAYPYVIRLNNQTSGSPGKYAVARYDTTHNPGITSTNAYNDNLWHYVTFQKYGANIYLYIDGKQDGNGVTDTTNVTTLNASPLYLGSRNGGSFPWQGALDDVKIYNYARTQQQIIEDMNGGHPTGGSPIGSQMEYWKFDEGFGQTTNNSIPGAANAILGATSGSEASDPSWKTTANCKMGNCLYFGGSQYVLGGNLGAFPPQGAISFWMYPTTVANYNNPLTTKYNGNNAGIRFEETTAGAFYAVPGNDAGTSGTISYFYNSGMTANSWYHVVYTWDTAANIQTGYINGKQVFSNSNTYWPTTLPNLAIGIGYNTSRGFVGYMDEVKVYNSALTADQVRIDYNAGSSLNFGVGAASESASLSDGAGNPPIAYYDFEERSGTALVDKSGNNYAGTVTCTGGGCIKPIWTTGKVGSAMTFDGVDDYINLPVSSTFLPGANAPITVEGWFKPSAIGASNYTNRCVSIASGPTGSAFLLGFDNTNKAFFYTSSTATRTPFSANAVLNQWTHLAVAYNGTQIQLYRDGKPDGAPFNSTLSAGDSTTAKLGTVVTANNNWFAGQMDEVKIYNYARTASQIAYDYNRGGPVGWWQFDECQGSTLHDASGNGNDGTWAGGTSIGTCTTPSTAWGNGVNGKFNSGLAFNSASSDYANMGDPANGSLDVGTNDFTLSAWIKTPPSSSAVRIISKRDIATGTGYEMYIEASSNDLSYYVRDASGNSFGPAGSSVNLRDNNWHHVAITFTRNSNALFYVDGNQIGTPRYIGNRVGSLANSVNLFMGVYSGTSYYNGLMDDVRIYNYALSTTQIKNLFNGGAAVKYGPTSGQP